MQTKQSRGASPLRLTQNDQAILGMLKQDAWRTISDIAGALTLSRTTVKERIDLMRERGVIKRFTIETEDAQPLETHAESAVFLLRLKRPVCRIIYGAISDWPELMGCWSIAGDIDMVVLITAPSNSEIERLRDKLARHPEVQRLQTLTILRDWINRSHSQHPKGMALLNDFEGLDSSEFSRL